MLIPDRLLAWFDSEEFKRRWPKFARDSRLGEILEEEGKWCPTEEGKVKPIERFLRLEDRWLLLHKLYELDSALCEARELTTQLLGPTSKASSAAKENWM